MGAYSFTIFDAGLVTTPYAGTYPTCMNDSDVVAGSFVDDDFVFHGFVRAPDGTITVFDVPGSDNTYVGGINSSGVICGYYTAGGVDSGFFRSDDGTITTFTHTTGTMVRVGSPWIELSTQLKSTGNCINSSGSIAGIWLNLHYSGFIREPDGTMIDFDLIGVGDYDHGIEITHINNNGDVCGTYSTSTGVNKSFVRLADGTISQFAAPDAGTGFGNGTLANAINNSGVVAGYYVDSDGHEHGFIRASDGTITEYDASAFTGTLGWGINDSGQSVGFTSTRHFNQLAYIRNNDGSFQTFDVLGLDTPEYDYGHSINTSGCISGSCVDDSNDIFRGFIGCPPGPPPPPTPTRQRCATTPPSGVMITGEFTRDLDANWDQQSTFIIQQSDPLPFTLRGIVLRMEYDTD